MPLPEEGTSPLPVSAVSLGSQAGLRCVHKVSGLRDPSANQPVFSWARSRLRRRMCTSPRSTFSQNPCSLSTLSCSSAAAGRLGDSIIHPAADASLGREGGRREGTRKGEVLVCCGSGTCQVDQWLRFHAPRAGGLGFDHWSGN